MNQYGVFAPYYDLLSAEFPVYRAGRVLGIEALDLKTGDQVLDLGCGTGLNFPLLRERIGTAGIIVGIDKSASMLEQASRRAEQHGWKNILLIEADATMLTSADIGLRVEAGGGRRRPAARRRGDRHLLAVDHAPVEPGLGEPVVVVPPWCPSQRRRYAGSDGRGGTPHPACSSSRPFGGRRPQCAPMAIAGARLP